MSNPPEEPEIHDVLHLFKFIAIEKANAFDQLRSFVNGSKSLTPYGFQSLGDAAADIISRADRAIKKELEKFERRNPTERNR